MVQRVRLTYIIDGLLVVGTVIICSSARQNTNLQHIASWRNGGLSDMDFVHMLGFH